MSTSTSPSVLAEHGWTAVPRSQSDVLASKKIPAKDIRVEDIPIPDTPLAKATRDYVKSQLPEQAFNHSVRVYYYGKAILAQHLPSFSVSDETYFLTCMLHDIGTTQKNQEDTLLSFEFYGASLAADFLRSQTPPSPKAQVEAVMEAIIRHQDLGETGTITQLGQLIQLATVFDNVGMNADLITKETIESVVKAWPRKRWTGCFAAVIRDELRLKPWAHTTAIEGFEEKVKANKLMEPYDETE